MTPAPRIGTEFAGYRIEGLLGRGGMGVVYRAEHPRLGALIALKVMDPELASNETFRERFVREARSAAAIKHPSIIPIYDAGEWHGELYIAMRYIEGDDLKSLIGKDGALPALQTYMIGAQIAGALDAAHRRGLIHRDVKPGNILIEPGPDADSTPIAYLTDLGLTKHVDSQSGVTGSGELLGTIDYIAPEQISGSRVDGRADVYSLACVFFECLTGSVPYVRENQAAVLWAHLHDDVPRASAFNPSLGAAVDAALARGMAKSPDDRFSTARELVESLQAPLETTTAVSRDGAPTQTWKMPSPAAAPTAVAPTAARRRRGRLALVLAVLVGLVLGGAAAAGVVLVLADDETAGSATSPEGQEPPASEMNESPEPAAFSPFDRELLKHVPEQYRARCQHARPLTDDFDATVSCRPGGPVSSLIYSHGKSGFLLYNQFESDVERAGLPVTQPPTMFGFCGTGEIPSINTTVAQGLSGRLETPEKVTREERLGYVLCHRGAGRFRIEWMTSEVAILAVATGEKLGPLYDWWQADAGPEP